MSATCDGLNRTPATSASPSANTGATRASHCSGSIPTVPSPSVTVRRPVLSASIRSRRSTDVPASLSVLISNQSMPELMRSRGASSAR
jgi:hypothetical protein